MRAAAHILVLSLFANAMCTPPSRGQSSDIRGACMVNIQDVGTVVKLIGVLGKPLGEKVQIKGRWHLPNDISKDDSLRFTVTHVNSCLLSSPIEYNMKQVRWTRLSDGGRVSGVVDFSELHFKLEANKRLPAPGEEWNCTAYETALVYMPPDESGEDNSLFPTIAVPYYYRPMTPILVAVVH